MYYYLIRDLDTREDSTFKSVDKLDMSEYGGFGGTLIINDKEYLVLEDVSEQN